MTDISPVPIVATPLPVDEQPVAIIATPTKTAPLADTVGNAYEVQIMRANGGSYCPINAATWTRNADNSFDVYDSTGALVASYAPGQVVEIQLVVAGST